MPTFFELGLRMGSKLKSALDELPPTHKFKSQEDARKYLLNKGVREQEIQESGVLRAVDSLMYAGSVDSGVLSRSMASDLRTDLPTVTTEKVAPYPQELFSGVRPVGTAEENYRESVISSAHPAWKPVQTDHFEGVKGYMGHYRWIDEGDTMRLFEIQSDLHQYRNAGARAERALFVGKPATKTEPATPPLLVQVQQHLPPDSFEYKRLGEFLDFHQQRGSVMKSGEQAYRLHKMQPDLERAGVPRELLNQLNKKIEDAHKGVVHQMPGDLMTPWSTNWPERVFDSALLEAHGLGKKQVAFDISGADLSSTIRAPSVQNWYETAVPSMVKKEIERLNKAITANYKGKGAPPASALFRLEERTLASASSQRLSPLRNLIETMDPAMDYAARNYDAPAAQWYSDWRYAVQDSGVPVAQRQDLMDLAYALTHGNVSLSAFQSTVKDILGAETAIAIEPTRQLVVHLPTTKATTAAKPIRERVAVYEKLRELAAEGGDGSWRYDAEFILQNAGVPQPSIAGMLNKLEAGHLTPGDLVTAVPADAAVRERTGVYDRLLELASDKENEFWRYEAMRVLHNSGASEQAVDAVLDQLEDGHLTPKALALFIPADIVTKPPAWGKYMPLYSTAGAAGAVRPEETNQDKARRLLRGLK
jgi:hypothetical protein